MKVNVLNEFDMSLECPFQVGDILFGDLGYSMKLPTFLEIVGIGKNGKSVIARELDTKLKSSNKYDNYQGVKIPIPGKYVDSKKMYKVRWRSADEPFVMVDKRFFSLWDGKPKMYDSLD